MIPGKIGRYEIKAELGRGGMATVYYAHDPRFKRDVAVKVLPPEFLHNPTFRARFDREAQTIASLEHPAIVPVYDFGEEAGQPYLVMRFMPGGSLDGRLNRGPLSLAEAARLMSRLAPALDEAHAHGIIHRDLKPGNILFDQRGDPHISDFGLAKLSEVGATFTGSYIVGTPAYMSPEQARGQPNIDGRSDIYALGAILFEVLTSKRPYIADTPMGLAVKHITEPVPRILAMKPDLPPACETVIARAMAKQPEARFATARELAAALEQVANGTTAPPAPVNEATLILAPEGRAPLPTSQLVRRRGIPIWGQVVAGLALLGLLGACLASALPTFMRSAATPTSTSPAPASTNPSSSAITLETTATPAPSQISNSTATSRPTFAPTQTLVIRPSAAPEQPTASPPASATRSASTPTGATPTHSNKPSPISPPATVSGHTSTPTPTSSGLALPSSTWTATPTNLPQPTATHTPVPPSPANTLVPPSTTPVPTTQVLPPTPTQDKQGPTLSNFDAQPRTVGLLNGCTVTFSADLNDPSGIMTATIEWQASGGGGSGSAPMTGPTSGGTWSSGTTPVSVPLLGQVTWKVTASDAFGNITTQDSGVTINAVGAC